MVVEPYLGAAAAGPLYGAAVELRCLAESLTRATRTPDGRTIVSGTVLRTDLDRNLTPETRITYDGRPVEVVSVRHFHGGGLATPDHTEITVQ